MTEPTPDPGQQPPPYQPGAGDAAAGLEPKIANLISYFFWGLGGLIIYLTQKNREVRFHGAQSILVAIAWTVMWVALSVLGFIPGVGLITLILMPIVGLAGLGLWIFLMIKGYGEEHFKLPVIGDMAEQWAAK